MSNIRLGIIGAGRMAREHLNVLRAINSVRVVAISSRTKSKAEALAQEFQIDHVYDDAHALVKESQLEGLLVLVTDDQMYDVVSQLIPYRIPLFIEKPPGLTPELTLKLSGLTRQYALPTMVGYNRRYYSIFQKGIAKILEFGSLLGISIEGHERMWRIHEAGTFNPKIVASWLYANSTHTIDLLRFFGGEVKELKVFGYKIRDPLGDQFAAVMKMDSGALAQYQAFWYSPGGWRVVLYGDGVTVEFKPLEKGQWTDKNFKIHEILPDPEDVQFKPGFYRQMQAFIHLIKEGKGQWPMMDLASAYETMLLAKKFADSAVSFKGKA